MVQWANFPWERPLFANADEAILRQAVATVENATANEAGGFSRFPGLKPFASFSGQRVYARAWRDDVYCVTDEGRTFRVDRQGNAEDVTGVPISGGRRVIMDATDDRLVMAAGGPLVQLYGAQTALLSPNAPPSTHVVYVDGYLLAIEPNSQRFRHCAPGEYDNWQAIDTFSANAKPDNIHAAVVTPYRELLIGGSEHIEQFERLPNGSQPFARRWSTGEGVAYPYTLVADKTGTYGVNSDAQFVRFAGQVSQNQSEAVGLPLSRVDDWTDAWAQSLRVAGGSYVLLQAPQASTPYGTKGLTLLLDLGNRRWSFLYDFDRATGRPTRYPAWSFVRAWNRLFAGVPGGLAEVDPETFDLLGRPMPFVIRSGHIDKFGPSRIDDVRIRVKRGVGATAAQEPLIGLRVNRDLEGFDQWTWESLGRAGHAETVIHFGNQGCADTWQFEISVTDPVAVEFVSMDIWVERLGW